MINEVKASNFKCFHNVAVSPKLVTLLIGGNGTGKSALLQAILLLKQWRGQTDELPLEGDFVRLDPGDFANHGYSPDTRQTWISLSGDWTVGSPDIDSPVTFNLDFGFGADAKVSTKGVRANMTWRGQRLSFAQVPGVPNLGVINIRGGISHAIGPVQGVELGSLGIPIDSSDDLLAPIRRALESPRALLSKVKFVPAIRGFVRPTYELGPELRDALVSSRGLSKQEEDTITALAYSPTETDQVSGWMKQVTGVGLKTDLIPPLTVKPVSVTTGGQPNLLSEGSGTNALVQLLFELARTKQGGTILIEEPEIHLHPKAQAELASVIVEEATSSNKQVIMTTHSEHIAGRLMTEIAEGNIPADQVAIYSFEKDAAGVCFAHPIELTADGQATGGLRSFFQTDLDEMRRYVDALRAKA